MFLTTLSDNLRIARNEANEDSTLLDLTTKGDYANRPAILGSTGIGVIDLHRPDGTEEEVTGQMRVNGIEFMFTGGSAAGKTFGYRLLAWRIKGPARLAAVGTGELGAQAVVTYPHNGNAATNKFWADNLTVTWENWPKEVEATSNTSKDSVSSVWLDDAGYRFWKVEITNADGVTGTEAGNVAVWWGYW
jgi:hypothetical protein